MCIRRPIVPVRAPPDPVRVIYSVSDDTIEQVTYIVCIHGWVLEISELWRINTSGVREVHLFYRVRLLDNFRKENFQTFSFNLLRCRIPFIGHRLLNDRVDFICSASTALKLL